MSFLRDLRSDRGAAAVEFAIVLPVLLFSLIVPVIELSRWYNVQLSVSNAASVAARTMAVENNQTSAKSKGAAAAPGLNPALGSGNISISGACNTNVTVTATVTYSVTSLTGLWPNKTLTGRGAALCSG